MSINTVHKDHIDYSHSFDNSNSSNNTKSRSLKNYYTISKEMGLNSKVLYNIKEADGHGRKYLNSDEYEKIKTFFQKHLSPDSINLLEPFDSFKLSSHYRGRLKIEESLRQKIIGGADEIIENEKKGEAPIDKNFKTTVINHSTENLTSNNNNKFIELTSDTSVHQSFLPEEVFPPKDKPPLPINPQPLSMLSNVVVVSNETFKARMLNKMIGGLPQDLLKRIIDRTDYNSVMTITPKNFKKIDDFFRTHLPGNPNLLEKDDIVRVNHLGKELDANNYTKSQINKLRKNHKILYSITDTVITKIKACINAYKNTGNVEIIVTDHTKKRTKFETIDNAKEHTNPPQNESFSEEIVDQPSKKTNNQPFAPQDILAFEGRPLNSQFLPKNISFLPIETVQSNNVETEYGRPFPNPQPIVSDPTVSEDPAPFLLNVIQPPLNQSQQQNEQIDLFGDDPLLVEKEQKLPDSDTHEQFNEPFNFTPDDELEELFLPKASVQTASTNSQASSAQDDLFLTFSSDDDVFPLETTWDNK